jgi:hypothetical protein
MKTISRHRLLAGAAVISATMLFGACSETDGTIDDGPATADGARTASLALTSDTLDPEMDIAGMKFTVEQVDCATGTPLGYTETKTADFEDLYLPGGIPAFEREPYDEDSQHIFADQAFWLDAGCYDVTAQPLDDSGDPSDDCFAAHKRGIEVHDGKTTEVLLISQCQGPARGMADIIGTINHPPRIDDFTYEPSKFVSTCWGVEFCVTASDPDNDPLEFEWEQLGGPTPTAGPAVSSTTMNPDGSVTQCGTIQPSDKGTYDLKVTVYDLGYDESGDPTRIEELLEAQDSRDDYDSRDDHEFPVHAGVECPAQGRTAVMMITMSNQPGPSVSQAERLARNAVNYVNPTIDPDPEILIIRDDNHNGEAFNDPVYIRNRLQNAGFTKVDLINEPSGPGPDGVQLPDLEPYEVVWLSNPGWPMDDVRTYNALMDFLALGGGLVLQGDDMGHSDSGFSMTPFTKLNYLNNGTTTCGLPTDNNAGFNYRVTIPSNGHPLNVGLEGESFLYGNDIDHTVRTFTGEEVIARATLAGPVPRFARRCARQFSTPVVIGIEP